MQLLPLGASASRTGVRRFFRRVEVEGLEQNSTDLVLLDGPPAFRSLVKEMVEAADFAVISVGENAGSSRTAVGPRVTLSRRSVHDCSWPIADFFAENDIRLLLERKLTMLPPKSDARL